MKKGLIIVVAVLLCAWSVLATIATISDMRTNKRLREENTEIEESLEEKERAYKKLEAEYAELEEEYAELETERDEYREKYLDTNSHNTLRFAYEWLFDMLANQGDANYNPQAALDKICDREGLGFFLKRQIAQEAQEILREYGY